MTRPSRQRARIDQIAALLDVTPSLRLRDLSQQMGVTEMTLRRDAAVDGSGFACRGGYLVPDRNTEHYDFELQMNRAIEAKQRAAQHALALVPEGAVIFLDAGTTLPHLARLLARERAAQIVTHCFTAAEILQGRSTVPVAFLGGDVRFGTRSCHPGGAESVIPQFKIDIAFLSAGGIDAAGRISCSHSYEIDLKRALIAAARQSYVVVDETKLGCRRTACFADVSEVGGIVTENGLLSAAQLENKLTKAGAGGTLGG